MKQLKNKHNFGTINNRGYFRLCRQCGMILGGSDPIPFYGCSEKRSETNKKAAYLLAKYGFGLTVPGF